MSTPPVISIVCCTHNRQSFVEQHFARLRDELPADVELIYALDNCSDGTRAYLEGAAAGRPNVRVLDYSGPGGLFNCRNFGLDVATGRYIHYLDDDDSVEPGYYRQLSALLGDARLAGVDIYLTGMQVDRLGAPKERQVIVSPACAQRGQWQGSELHLRGDFFGAILRGEIYFNGANALFSRRLFARRRFRGDVRKSADWLFNLEAALQQPLYFVVNETLQANYFVHASSMSVSPDKSYWNARIFDMLLEQVAVDSEHYAHVRDTCARANFSAGFDKRRTDKRAALRHYVRALRLGLVGMALLGIAKLPFQWSRA
jgi:glycosyltransferase involved in cell wall biosynthesis